EGLSRLLDPQLAPPGTHPKPTVEVVGTSQTRPTGATEWTAEQLRPRVHVLSNRAGGQTVWLASDTDAGDAGLRARVEQAAVPEGFVGLVAPGGGGRVWVDGGWVKPELLAEVLTERLGGSRPYFLI